MSLVGLEGDEGAGLGVHRLAGRLDSRASVDDHQ